MHSIIYATWLNRLPLLSVISFRSWACKTEPTHCLPAHLMVAMSKLTKSFIESHTSSIPSVPKEWDVYGGHYYYYQLSFRMCQLRNLKYEFDWGDERWDIHAYHPPAIQILRLYDIEHIMGEMLSLHIHFGDFNSDPASNPASITHQPSRILVLDLSLNDLSTLDHVGLAPLKQLRVINASFNHIEK